MAFGIAEKWLAALAKSNNNKDYCAHMELVSKRVNVLGAQGIDVMDYAEWARQRKYEFDNNICKHLSFDRMKIVTHGPKRVLFHTLKIIESYDGTSHTHGVEIIIECENDGKWRILQERTLTAEKTVFNTLSRVTH